MTPEVQNLLLHIRSREDMHAVFNNIYTQKGRRPSLKSVAVLTDLDPMETGGIIESDERLAKSYSLEAKKLADGFFRYSITKKMPKGRTVKGNVLVDSEAGGWVLLTTAKHYFAEKVLLVLLERIYPNVTTLHLNYAQISGMLERIRDSYHGQKLLTYYAIRKEVDTPEGPAIERQTLRGPEAEKNLLSAAQENTIWIERLRFKVVNQSKMMLLDAFVTGGGLSRLIYGSFTEFRENVIGALLGTGKDWNGKYSKVSRKILEEDVELRPCTITYRSHLQLEHLQKLAISLPSNYLTSLIHGGNPYFVADLLDNEDGSSFGLTVLGETVTIVPMLKSSPSALWKITQKIQEVLGEGNIAVATAG